MRAAISSSSGILNTPPFVSALDRRTTGRQRAREWPLWLGEDPAEASALKPLLTLFPSDGMTCWPVSAGVGNVKNNDASLIEPIKTALR